MKQTAVEWLENQFEESHSYINEIFKETIEQAKEMHKQEIIDAFWSGDNSDCTSEDNSKEYAEQYYTEQFKTK